MTISFSWVGGMAHGTGGGLADWISTAERPLEQVRLEVRSVVLGYDPDARTELQDRLIWRLRDLGTWAGGCDRHPPGGRERRPRCPQRGAD